MEMNLIEKAILIGKQNTELTQEKELVEKELKEIKAVLEGEIVLDKNTSFIDICERDFHEFVDKCEESHNEFMKNIDPESSFYKVCEKSHKEFMKKCRSDHELFMKDLLAS